MSIVFIYYHNSVAMYGWTTAHDDRSHIQTRQVNAKKQFECVVKSAWVIPNCVDSFLNGFCSRKLSAQW